MKLTIVMRAAFLFIMGLLLSGPLLDAVQIEVDPKAGLANTLHREGRGLESKGDYAGALFKYEAGLQAARAAGNREAEGQHLLGIGSVKMVQGDYRTALEAIERARQVAEEITDQHLLARALLQMGSLQERQSQYEAAMRNYETALKIGEEGNHKAVVVSSLNGIGVIHYRQGRYPQAREYYQRALKIWEELADKGGIASALTNIGTLHQAQGSQREAHEHYQRALKLREELKDKKGIAILLNNLGNVQATLGSDEEARDLYQRSLEIKQELGDRRGIPLTLNNIGRMHAVRGSFAEAVEHYQRALDIYQELEDRRGLAATLTLMGAAYEHQGRREEGLAQYQRSLKIGIELKDKLGITATLNNIGLIYARYGSYAEAFAYYQKALKIHEELDNKSGWSRTLNSVGSLFMSQGLYSAAVDHFQRALQMAETLGGKELMATTLNNLASVYDRQGLYERAVDYYQRALQLREALKDRLGISDTLIGLGVVYEHQGSHEKALHYFQKALPITQAINAKSTTARALNNIGQAYLALKQFPQAMEAAQQALALGEAIKGSEIIWFARYNLARVQERLAEPALALKHYQLAIAEIEKVRAQPMSSEEKAGYFAGKLGIYEDLIRCLHKLASQNPAADYGRQAFAIAERGRARAFLDLLSEARVDWQGEIDTDLLERKRKIEARLSFLQRNLQQAFTQPKRAEPRTADWSAELDWQYSEYEQLQREIRRRHPRSVHAEPIGVEHAQRLLDEETVLLAYSITKESAFLFALTRGNYQMYRLPQGRDEIEKLIREQRAGSRAKKWLPVVEMEAAGIRQVLIEPPPDPGQPANLAQPAYYAGHYLKRARQLYDLLIKPAESLLAGKKQLIIVPDGILAYLPFEVLLAKEVRPRKGEVIDFRKLPYLIRDYTIHYAPSVSVLGHLKNPREPVSKPQKELLAFGDPAYGPLGRVAGMRGEEEHYLLRTCEASFKSLSYSREEIQRIARLFPPASVTTYLGADAREENLKKENLGDYRRIHFATHGCLNENRPHFSALILSQANGGPEDGFLQLYEVFHLKLNAELVVLSACATGLGKEVRGEGLIGLTRGFMTAGTPSVVASLWNVADFTSAVSMEKFYRNLKGQDKAEALRQAKLDIIKNGIHGSPYYSHPFFWAPFILMGERN